MSVVNEPGAAALLVCQRGWEGGGAKVKEEGWK